jgi:magnesium-transporting ATPase (P-type)
MVATGRGAQLGIVIRDAGVLEQAGRVTAALLDKTGTVTDGRMALVEVAAADGVDPAELLAWQASLEDASEHPVARAVAEGPGTAGWPCPLSRRSPSCPARAWPAGSAAASCWSAGPSCWPARLERSRRGGGRRQRRPGHGPHRGRGRLGRPG